MVNNCESFFFIFLHIRDINLLINLRISNSGNVQSNVLRDRHCHCQTKTRKGVCQFFSANSYYWTTIDHHSNINPKDVKTFPNLQTDNKLQTPFQSACGFFHVTYSNQPPLHTNLSNQNEAFHSSVSRVNSPLTIAVWSYSPPNAYLLSVLIQNRRRKNLNSPHAKTFKQFPRVDDEIRCRWGAFFP